MTEYRHIIYMMKIVLFVLLLLQSLNNLLQTFDFNGIFKAIVFELLTNIVTALNAAFFGIQWKLPGKPSMNTFKVHFVPDCS